ncbi:MAG: hypothetical protein CSA81_04205 [Acidobacteria bacterium]|nr:MAG: hypothetical protein CSA81_04205 [Acidobacteriota bacterium]
MRSIKYGVMTSVFLACMSLFGGGFGLFEHSTKALGMGGAFVARADNATAIYFNPAGITQLEGLSWALTTSPIQPNVSLTDTGGNQYKVDSSLTVIPSLYLTYQLSDQFWLGVGSYVPFGLATKMEENWAGRYNSHNADASSLNLNLNLAYKVNDHLSLAFGLDAQMFDVTLEQKILPSAIVYSQREGIMAGLLAQGMDAVTAEYVFNTQFLAPSAELKDINQEISGDKTCLGYNLALHYKPNDFVSMGVSYRSSVDYDIDGKAKYRDVTQGFIFPFESIFYDAPGLAKIELPSFLYFGFAYFPNEKLCFEIDAWQSGWSTYDVLDVFIENGLQSVQTIKNWDDVWMFRAGCEYVINDSWYATLGYLYDESPIPDEHMDFTLPASDRDVYSFGIGFTKGNYCFEASYGYLKLQDRHVEARPSEFILEMDIEGDVNLYSIGVTYKK